MIVKIENLEQEKYVLFCAEKDGLMWINEDKPLSWLASDNYGFPINIDYKLEMGVTITREETHTFEQFKAQREEQIKTKESLLTDFWNSEECTSYLDEQGDELGFKPEEWIYIRAWMHEFRSFQVEPIKTDLEKENEELKKKLEKIKQFLIVEKDIHLLNQISNPLKITDEIQLQNFTKIINVINGVTPSQKEANEIIKNASTEVLEELKKLL